MHVHKRSYQVVCFINVNLRDVERDIIKTEMRLKYGKIGMDNSGLPSIIWFWGLEPPPPVPRNFIDVFGKGKNHRQWGTKKKKMQKNLTKSLNFYTSRLKSFKNFQSCRDFARPLPSTSCFVLSRFCPQVPPLSYIA